MALTREFRETVAIRARRDRSFRRALLIEAVDALLQGELAEGKSLLRDFVNATTGFRRLAELTGIPDKSLQRMLGPRGNPNAENLLGLIHELQRREGVVLVVRPKRRAA
jgi:DNA-binding phage protein